MAQEERHESARPPRLFRAPRRRLRRWIARWNQTSWTRRPRPWWSSTSRTTSATPTGRRRRWGWTSLRCRRRCPRSRSSSGWHGCHVPRIYLRGEHSHWFNTDVWLRRGAKGNSIDAPKVPIVEAGSWGAEFFEAHPQPDESRDASIGTPGSPTRRSNSRCRRCTRRTWCSAAPRRTSAWKRPHAMRSCGCITPSSSPTAWPAAPPNSTAPL